MENKRIVLDDENKDWRAVLDIYDTVAALSFVTKPGEIPVQGDIDEVLGWDDIPTGIWDLTLFADDGSFLVDYADRTPEEIEEFIPELINYFKELYEKNKKKFAKGVKSTLKEYGEL